MRREVGFLGAMALLLAAARVDSFSLSAVFAAASGYLIGGWLLWLHRTLEKIDRGRL